MICVFKIPSQGHPAGDSAELRAAPGESRYDMMGGRIAFGVRIGGQDDLPHLSGFQAGLEFSNPQLVRPHAIDWRERPSQHVVAASESPAALDGHEIGRFLDSARAQFDAAGRTGQFGLRTHLIVRQTESAAWDAAEELLSRAAAAVKEQRRAVYAGTPMVGQRAQSQAVAQHRVGAHLWNGISTVRVNCGTAIVGTPEQVTDLLLDYWKLGVDEFILSGFPHVEECQRVATDVLPLLRQKMAAVG